MRDGLTVGEGSGLTSAEGAVVEQVLRLQASRASEVQTDSDLHELLEPRVRVVLSPIQLNST